MGRGGIGGSRGCGHDRSGSCRCLRTPHRIPPLTVPLPLPPPVPRLHADELPDAETRALAVRVIPAAERSLRDGHPWVFATSIRDASREGAAGDPAVIFDRKDRFLAAGLWDPHGPIRVRALAMGSPERIGPELFRKRVQAAVALRRPLLDDPETTGVRILYGESDGLSGVVCDRYGSTLVLKVYSSAWLPHLPALADALEAELPTDGLLVLAARRVPVAAEGERGFRPGLLRGVWPDDGALPFLEGGLRFEAHPLVGHKTGFYLDQRDNRARIRRAMEARPGQRVLNVFSYTGGFSVAAAAGGAAEVSSLDVSEAALAQAQRHMELNREIPGVRAARHTRLRGDAFELLEAMARRGERFGTVVVDPPSFAKEARQAPAALARYGRLAELALAVLEPGGLLLQASCSSRVSREDFMARIHQAARDAGRPLTELEQTEHPLDHPVRIPENAYLKALLAWG